MSDSNISSSAEFVDDSIDAEYINVLNRFEDLDPDFYSYQKKDHLSGDSFQNLSKSDYAKVIFCDLYYNSDSTVGCRFQITDNVHEDPCDYIGLFRVGYDNLSQCLASKMLSNTDCEDDGKLLRCTFKPSELPELENGFYQFLYVTRDNEVCGASMPFQIKNSITKGLCSDEDVVADNSEDDFLIVRSNMAEKNRRLQALLDEMTEKCLKHESEMREIQEKLKIVSEEKIKIEHLLKEAYDDKKNLSDQALGLKEERDVVWCEKEEAVRNLKEKNKVFISVINDYTEKFKEFAELKDKSLTEKNKVIAESNKLQDQVNKLTGDLKKKQASLEVEQEEKQEFITRWLNDSSALTSKLDEAKQTIEALEKNKQLSMEELASLNERVASLRQELKSAKCQNLALHTKLVGTMMAQEKFEEKIENMQSEITALKLHILELHDSKSTPSEESKSEEKEFLNLKTQYEQLQSELKEKNDTISELKEELTKVNGVVESLLKGKETILKNENLLQDALNECILRLNEASKLYKTQFRKIEKLKKKLKLKTNVMDMNSASASIKDSCSSVTDFTDEINSVKLPQNQHSDSDTGEHVLRQPINIEKKKSSGLFEVKKLKLICEASSLDATVENEPTSPRIREVPELQTLIEMNLEKFKNSQSKEDDDVMYSIPCPVCEQDVGVHMTSSEELVKHLEMQHKQQVCPICGRLYDMNLPPKYFLFHVEDHFVKENKN